VFVISGAVAEQVVNAGPVATYGPNDMVLDNWGQVRSWAATAPVTSHGSSGIGFVNFGDLDRLDVGPPVTIVAGEHGLNLGLGDVWIHGAVPPCGPWPPEVAPR
jgi:hypothetical protein